MVDPMPPASDPGQAVERPGSTPGSTVGDASAATSLADPRAPERVVVIGASAGGVEALMRLVRSLPPSFSAPIVVVLHLPSAAISRLPDILARTGALRAIAATHGAPLEPGVILVAPPDRHVVSLDHRGGVVEGPRENGVRPAIDPLFRSVARTFGEGAIGVILSGTLDDGTAGTAAIHAAGGITVAQEPDDAICPGMPQSAIENAHVDHVASAEDIADLLVSLVGRPPADARRTKRAPTGSSKATDLVCPECGGVLRVFDEHGVVRFHCRVGHNYSPETLYAAQDARLEAGLWAAIRALEESASLARRLANGARQRGAVATAARFDAREVEAAERADLIRSAILTLSDLDETPDIAEPEPVTSEDDRSRELLGIDEREPESA